MAKSLVSELANERGSAVTEFVMLSVPVCLVFVAAMNYCLNSYFDSLLRYEAASVARFAALADVTLVEASERSAAGCVRLPTWLQARCGVATDSSASLSQASISYQPLSIILIQPERVNIVASVALEISK